MNLLGIKGLKLPSRQNWKNQLKMPLIDVMMDNYKLSAVPSGIANSAQRGRNIISFVITAKQGQQVWDIRDMKKGVYLYTLKAGAMSKNGKLIIN